MRERAQRATTLATVKNDGKTKVRNVCDGSGARDWIGEEDTASPTATDNGLMLTVVVDAEEGRGIVANDAPNAFT